MHHKELSFIFQEAPREGCLFFIFPSRAHIRPDFSPSTASTKGFCLQFITFPLIRYRKPTQKPASDSRRFRFSLRDPKKKVTK